MHIIVDFRNIFLTVELKISRKKVLTTRHAV